MRTLRESLNERLKDENFRMEYEAIQPEMNAIRAEIEAKNNIEKSAEQNAFQIPAYAF